MTETIPLYPAALQPGDTIGVIAPSSRFDVEALQPAVDYLTYAGFKVIFHPQTSLSYGQFAGTPAERAAALHDYFAEEDIKAIFCTVGGNGSIHLLDLLDYDLIKANPKILIGFSDGTALLNAISAKTGLVTFHGPTMTRIGKLDTVWPAQMLDVLTGRKGTAELTGCKNTNKQVIEGTLYGGNLSVLQTLIGTPYAPDMDKAVLLIEDINDHLSRYDRMLAHTKQAGWLQNLSGLILGDFLKSLDNPDRPFGFDIEEIAQSNAPKGTPIVTNAPIGHGERLCTLPIGAKVSLKNNQISFKSLS